MDKPRDIAIVGYGTAGQALAVLLTRDGHRVLELSLKTNRVSLLGERRKHLPDTPIRSFPLGEK